MNLPQGILKGTGTILLVDDEAIIRDVSSRMLQKMGYEPLLAENGSIAIETFQNHHEVIVAVILDMILPDMDGPEVFSQLKKIDPNVKVIISSGYNLNNDATALMKQGCRGFIKKPFDLETLSHKLGEVLAE